MAALAGAPTVFPPTVVPHRLSLRDNEILHALGTYQVVTAVQLATLLFKPSILTYVRQKLRALVAAGYVDTDFLPRTSRLGSSPLLYLLGRKGVAVLHAQGLAVPRYRPPEERGHSLLWNPHAVALSDVLLSLTRLVQTDPSIELAELRHERLLTHTPVHLTSESGATATSVRPDAWVDLWLTQGSRRQRMCLALELDRGTEHHTAWRRKVRALLGWACGPYQEHYETQSLTIPVVTTAGERRCRDLRAWTRAELEASGLAGEVSCATLFVFTHRSAATTSPRDFWQAPIWSVPGRATPMGLLAEEVFAS